MLTSRLTVDKFAFRTICERSRANRNRALSAGIMNLRIAASLVFVGTLGYACGPRTRSDVATDAKLTRQQGIALASMGGTAAPSTETREKKLKRGSATLTTKFEVVSRGDDDV